MGLETMIHIRRALSMIDHAMCGEPLGEYEAALSLDFYLSNINMNRSLVCAECRFKAGKPQGETMNNRPVWLSELIEHFCVTPTEEVALGTMPAEVLAAIAKIDSLNSREALEIALFILGCFAKVKGLMATHSQNLNAALALLPAIQLEKIAAFGDLPIRVNGMTPTAEVLRDFAAAVRGDE